MAKTSTSFEAGKSGNPKGRPKDIIIVKEAARLLTKEAIDTLADIMHNGLSESARVSAANAILDRGWGKPAQELDHKSSDGTGVQVFVTCKT